MVLALAALQGLTEFLPVSSSGHLRLLAAAFGIEEPQTLFDILLHAGTLAAVFIVYRALFARMLGSVWQAITHPTAVKQQFAVDTDLRLVAYTVLATIPTGVIALALGDAMERLASSVGVVGAALMVTGLILFVMRAFTVGRWRATAERPARPLEALTWRDALIIGTVQGVAAMRGISRSGSTITAGLACGLDQAAAAAFSFVLAVPAILGALVLHLRAGGLSADGLAHALVGAVVAAVVGTVALLTLLRLLRGGRLHLFAWYCLALGAAAIVWDLVGQ